jgi:hypothetical protein
MKKYSVAHIHSDKKFLQLGDAFFSAEFNNKLIFIGDKIDTTGKFKNDIHFFEKNKKSVAKIIGACQDIDLVIFYSIDEIVIKIILELPKKYKIGWRFFGFELYARNREKYITNTTQAIIDEGNMLNNSGFIYGAKSKLRFILKLYQKHLFLKAISRCNLFFGLYEEEYLMLKKEYPNLPHFIPVSLNMDFLQTKSLSDVKKEKYILVGNNRNLWNNHLDILEIIKRNKNGGDYKAKLLLNYGNRGYYYKKLMQFASSIEDVELIEEFMSMEDFDKLYLKCAALVINSKRQMAGNNIRKALEHGTKVYLNTANSFYDYLKNNNFIVYNIQEFESDFLTGNLLLDKESAQHNFNQLIELTKKNSDKIFRNNVLKFLESAIKS